MKKKMWVVKLIVPPKPNHYPDKFFPRTFYYKRDAISLMAEVVRRGGDAKVLPA
jgi:hypothetical protein